MNLLLHLYCTLMQQVFRLDLLIIITSKKLIVAIFSTAKVMAELIAKVFGILRKIYYTVLKVSKILEEAYFGDI
eukprot:snap_masked-scaffold_9-processed-gene-10.11-mRNA-1 protein AED:1.00 eAED:1.00 QI:0/-1/0/0/-1/1/1/0/73